MEFFRAENCDVIILGCTHFLNFTDVFDEACKPDIKVVDSVDGVVRHALEVGDFKGVSPLGERVASNEVRAQGETSPSQTPNLFITGFRDIEEENQYNVLCSRFGIKFGGLLSK